MCVRPAPAVLCWAGLPVCRSRWGRKAQVTRPFSCKLFLCLFTRSKATVILKPLHVFSSGLSGSLVSSHVQVEKKGLP